MANTTKDLYVFAHVDGEFVPAGQLQVNEEGRSSRKAVI